MKYTFQLTLVSLFIFRISTLLGQVNCNVPVPLVIFGNTNLTCFGDSTDLTAAALIFHEDFEDAILGSYQSDVSNVGGIQGLDYANNSPNGRLRFNTGFNQSGNKAASMDNPGGESTNWITQTIDMSN